MAFEKTSETFAYRLSELLEKQGMSQKELAERVGITEASMSRYMNTDRIPKSEILANIATALHTTSDYLLGVEEEGNIDSDYPKIVRLIARNSLMIAFFCSAVIADEFLAINRTILG